MLFNCTVYEQAELLLDFARRAREDGARAWTKWMKFRDAADDVQVARQEKESHD